MVRQLGTDDSSTGDGQEAPRTRNTYQLTKRFIDGLELPSDKYGRRYYDSETRGFGIWVFPSGKKTFFVEYGERGRQRRMKVGRYGQLTLVQARKLAKEKIADYIRANDPLDARNARRNELTFADWADDYIKRMTPHKKHIRDDVRYLGEAKARWGHRPLGSVTAEEIESAVQDKQQAVSGVTANRFLASVRACLQDAWRKDKIVQNPAMKVHALPENPPRARTLHDDEFVRVLDAIEQLESVYAKTGLKLLIQTGARLSEVLNAKWEDVDLEHGSWRIPSPKAGKPQFVPLQKATVEMLKSVPRMGCYIVAGRTADKPRTDLKKAWEIVLERAQVEGVHIHDIRRTFGLQVTKTDGLHVASKLLRHSSIQVTERHYAPLDFEDLRSALDDRAKAVATIQKQEAKKAKERKRSPDSEEDDDEKAVVKRRRSKTQSPDQ